jgi:hypothetical protein
MALTQRDFCHSHLSTGPRGETGQSWVRNLGDVPGCSPGRPDGRSAPSPGLRPPSPGGVGILGPPCTWGGAWWEGVAFGRSVCHDPGTPPSSHSPRNSIPNGPPTALDGPNSSRSQRARLRDPGLARLEAPRRTDRRRRPSGALRRLLDATRPEGTRQPGFESRDRDRQCPETARPGSVRPAGGSPRGRASPLSIPGRRSDRRPRRPRSPGRPIGGPDRHAERRGPRRRP